MEIFKTRQVLGHLQPRKVPNEILIQIKFALKPTRIAFERRHRFRLVDTDYLRECLSPN